MRISTTFLAAALFAAAALPALAASTHSETWYLANANARTAELAACQADRGDLAATPDCINAQAASRSAALAVL